MDTDKRPSWRIVAAIIAMLLAVGYGVPIAVQTILCFLGLDVQDRLWVGGIVSMVVSSLLALLILVARLVKGQRLLSWQNTMLQLEEISSFLKIAIIVIIAILALVVSWFMSNPESEWYALAMSLSSAVFINILSILVVILYSKKDIERTHKKMDTIDSKLDNTNSTLQDIKTILERIEKRMGPPPPPPSK